jgi:hypothetical protein
VLATVGNDGYFHYYYNCGIYYRGKLWSSRGFTVKSTHALEDGIRGTIQFSGKTRSVQFQQSNVTWHICNKNGIVQ